MLNPEGAAHILRSLGTGQADLGSGRARALKHIRYQLRMRNPIAFQSCMNNQLCLIKAALMSLRAMQRNWNYEDWFRIHSQLLNGFGEHPPEDVCSRNHLFVLEQMNQLAQLAIVGTIGDGFGELGRRLSACKAKFSLEVRRTIVQALAANITSRARDWRYLPQATLANRQPGNVC
ncbi:MAG TPA: hypothetical protein VJO35_03360 [Terriglobales bacterium]|nr:hypothetical protein [Terriglobales bacterium]